MKFTKMQGAGNDFIIINNIEENIPEANFTKLAAYLCRRRLSIGADGMMFVSKAIHGGDFKMDFYNADGSRGEMCGNGARCIARYGYEMGLSGEIGRIETTAGEVIGYRQSEALYKIRLNNPSVIKPDYPVKVLDTIFDCAYVELGNPGIPHAVIPYPDLNFEDIESIRSLGRALRYHEAYPKGANINFYQVIGTDTVKLLTYERGVEDFTLACGTGSASVAVILNIKGLVSTQNVEIRTMGGSLFIDINRKDTQVEDLYLTGPALIIAEGTVIDLPI